MSYQAVVRDGSNNLVSSTSVGMQISILQGSASGTAVYVETQTPTSNANGLVSLEIGSGTVVSGTFASIDWANGPYFIKTETDPTGGTNYTITGTSQLLSVPYALHAKTAELVTGTITETDPTFTGSQAANINATDITNLGNLSGVNTGDQDLSTLATNTALADSTAQVRSEIPDVSGFLTSETDPTFTGSQAANITAGDITNLGNLSGTNTGDQDISGIATNATAISTIQSEQTTQNTAIALNTAKKGEADGSAAGQMKYWNGTAWVVVPTTVNEDEGATLQMIGGVPTWTGGTTPNVTNPTTGEIWMDRNLGASQVATSSTDALAYGDLYQWGRGTDGHQIRTSGTTTTLSSTDQPGHGDFILPSNSPYDWLSPQNTNLWQGVNGENNPCPSGYRLPTSAELDAERSSWSSNNSAGAFASPLKLPVAGNRNYSNGSLNDVGTTGLYWSSTVFGTSAYYLGFNSSLALMDDYSRANGFSVRCLKD
jgi:uncharacterized protein (TIGR02145 family)